MTRSDLAASVKAMRPFLPARDFDTSKRFYGDLGFTLNLLGPDLAEMHLGAHSFLLQNYFVAEWAANFVMHVLVADVGSWWRHIAALDLAARYGVESPRAPKREEWGLVTTHVFDPSGVLWHFAELPPRPA
jgi:hypothetical protein